MPSEFSDQRLHLMTETMRAIGHPVRMQIIEMLHRDGPQTVKQIHERLSLTQPVTSNHLRLLKDRAVVTSVRKGQNSIYQLRDPNFYELIRLAEALV